MPERRMKDIEPWFPAWSCDDCDATEGTDYIGDILCDECFSKRWKAAHPEENENR